jgi:probable H4MPT-linked C1 transfer pathway protein
MSAEVLGLDIGGANLKAATSNGVAVSRPFALWKYPQRLAEELRSLLEVMPRCDRVAVTMTGELCDCYETKRQGVNTILDAVAESANGITIMVWSVPGNFSDLPTARQRTLQVAAANWLALATFAGRFAPHESALLIDVGSTTTDIIPLQSGRPTPSGFTDTERLLIGELVYTGVRRTPVCALLGRAGMAEFFATMHDVHLILGNIPEDPNDTDTADGRPATRPFALARLARMIGGDTEITAEPVIIKLAKTLAERQQLMLQEAIQMVVERMPSRPQTVIVSGSGEFLATWAAAKTLGPGPKYCSLTSKLGASISGTACAYAAAVLAKEMC